MEVERKEAIKEIKKIINKYANTIQDEAEAVRIKSLAYFLTHKSKKGDAPKTERGEFMGKCMRKIEKGGEGKNMSKCSTEWKEYKEVLKR